MIHLRRVGDVTLALAPLTALDAVRAAAFGDLGPDERARLERLPDVRADEFLLGRHLLRELVRMRTDEPGRDITGEGWRLYAPPNFPADAGEPIGDSARRPARGTAVPIPVAARCPVCGGPHGRPVLVGHPLVASIAHGGGLVVAAVAPSTRVAALGVDVEALGDASPGDLSGPDGSRSEPGTADTGAGAALGTALGAALSTARAADAVARTRGWVRYEATMKADGRGVVGNRGESAPTELARLVGALPHRYEVTDLELPDLGAAAHRRYALALAQRAATSAS